MYDGLINKLSSQLEMEKAEYYKQKGKLDILIEQIDDLNDRGKALKKQNETLQKVKFLLQNASQYAREQSKKQMEYTVTQCLQYIFDPSLEFKIEIVEKSNRIEAEFYVISNINGEQIKTKPQDSRGGGIVDIISLAIRIAMMEINEPKIQGPLILDEPAKHVSDEFITNVSEFLKQIGSTFKRQIIMVTHNNYLLESADICYRVSLKEGVSIVEVLNLT